MELDGRGGKGRVTFIRHSFDKRLNSIFRPLTNLRRPDRNLVPVVFGVGTRWLGIGYHFYGSFVHKSSPSEFESRCGRVIPRSCRDRSWCRVVGDRTLGGRHCVRDSIRSYCGGNWFKRSVIL